MALPRPEAPIFHFTLPSTGKSIKFRPWTVGSEKSLLIAQQSENLTNMIATLKNIIDECTFKQLDIEKLASFDIEFAFLNIRAKSVGEIVELIVRCEHCKDNPQAQQPYSLDLTKIQISRHPDHNNRIKLFADVGVVFKYPGFEFFKQFENKDLNNIETMFQFLIECIDYIYDGQETFKVSDQNADELKDFIDNLTTDQFKKLIRFFETMPKVELPIEFTCRICNKLQKRSISGLENFF
jgi:hypothetical protein